MNWIDFYLLLGNYLHNRGD